MESGYNAKEVQAINDRILAIENLLGMNAIGRITPSFATMKSAHAANASAVAGQLDVAGSVETITADAAALSVTKLLSNISAAGAQSRTLAAPAANGQLKLIVMTVHGGDVSLAATNIGAGTGSATFVAVGACLLLLSAGGKWHKIGGTAAIA